MKGLFKKKTKNGPKQPASPSQPPPEGKEKERSKEEEPSLERKDDETSCKEEVLATNEKNSTFETTVYDDLYGQVIPKETPELLSSKFEELEIELRKIPDDKKQDWRMALEKCPDLCDEAFKLMFLRCEVLNADLAAKRIVKYWKKRVQIFGEDKAFLPLTLGDDGPFKDDTASLDIGFMRLTNKRDSAGRPILFADPSRLPMDQSSYENESICRALWYVMHALIEDETAQRKGSIIVVFPKNSKFAQFNRKLVKMNADSIKGCIPVRLSALHICHPPAVFDLFFPILKILMGAHLRQKIKLNSGSDEEVMEKLGSQFGITNDELPTEMGGTLVLNHEQWLKERLEKGY